MAAPASAAAAGPGRPTPVGLLPAVVLELFRREPLFAGAALVLLALMVPTALAAILDDRTLGGVDIWLKPLKFELSLALYLGTLAWFAGWLPARVAAGRAYRFYAGFVVACIAGEMAWLIGAAGYGTASHFNTDVPLLVAVYPLMGALAIGLTSAALVYAVLIARSEGGGASPALRSAVVLGLGLTFVLTLPTAGFMASQTGHAVGGTGSDAAGLALLGWLRDAGDLRVAHFFATHAMQALPLFGLLAGRMLSGAGALLAVRLFAAGYTLLVGAVFAEALIGRPFLAALG